MEAGRAYVPSIGRSFQDLLAVQIAYELTKY